MSVEKPEKQLGILIGGSGLIGGAIGYYFTKRCNGNVQILAPNSKRLSLRSPSDIKQYLQEFRPDFIVNSAIATIDSDPKMAYEINYLGSINLAKAAIAFKIPYIYISSAAVLKNGQEIKEDDVRPLSAQMSNYAKSKLMCEKTLQHLAKHEGLDYTAIRLAVVYGKHDHKIQGFHRMLFSIADQSMTCLLTRRGVCHSYSNAKKIPVFIDYVLRNRDEFRGQTFNFVDPNSVSLAQLILTVKSYLEQKKPYHIYLPLPIAKTGAKILGKLVRLLSRLGIDARMPAELMFLNNFYQSQTLSSTKLQQSSFPDPFPKETVFSVLPELIEYYVTRWEHLNLISSFNEVYFDPQHETDEFISAPEELLEKHHKGDLDPFCNFFDLEQE